MIDMSDRPAKDALFDAFASVAQALGSGRRAEIVDLVQTNTGLTGISATGSGFSIENLNVDCANLGTSTGIAFAAASFYGSVGNCNIGNFTTVGISLNCNYGVVQSCELTGGGTAATAAINALLLSARIFGCNIHDNQCSGIAL